MIKIGTDIIQISRIKHSIDKFGIKFLEKYLTDNEIKLINKVETAAGFWAAKEAVSKALECGIGKDLAFKDIYIFKTKKGAPHFRLNKKINLDIISSSLSISHDGDFAIAVVTISISNKEKI